MSTELEIEKYPCILHGIVECAGCKPWPDRQANHAELGRVVAERNRLRAENKRLTAQRDEAIAERDAAQREVERLRGELEETRAALGVVVPLLTIEQVVEWRRVEKAHRAEREALKAIERPGSEG